MIIVHIIETFRPNHKKKALLLEQSDNTEKGKHSHLLLNEMIIILKILIDHYMSTTLYVRHTAHKTHASTRHKI